MVSSAIVVLMNKTASVVMSGATLSESLTVFIMALEEKGNSTSVDEPVVSGAAIGREKTGEMASAKVTIVESCMIANVLIQGLSVLNCSEDRARPCFYSNKEGAMYETIVSCVMIGVPIR